MTRLPGFDGTVGPLCSASLPIVLGLGLVLSFLFLCPTLCAAETGQVPGADLFSQGKFKEAAETARQALQKAPNDPLLNRLLGLSLLELQDAKGAIAPLEIAHAAMHLDTDLTMALAQAYSSAGDNASAITLYRTLVRGEPGNVWYRYKLAEALGWIKHYDESVTQYKTILEQEPDNTGVRLNLAEVLAWRAMAESDTARLSEAMTEWRQLSRKDPTNVTPHLKLGWAHLERREIGSAVRHLEKAHALDPQSTEVAFLLAEAYARRGQYRQAVNLCHRMLGRSPDDLGMLHRLAQSLSWAGKYHDALGTYRRILELDPANVGAQLGMAQVLAWQGDFAESRSVYDSVLAADPDHKGALIGLAELEQQRWNWSLAKSFYERVLALYPSDRGATIGLAQLREIMAPHTEVRLGTFNDLADFRRDWRRSQVSVRVADRSTLQVGYEDWAFGQAGLEADRDEYLLAVDQHIKHGLDLRLSYSWTDFSPAEGKDLFSAQLVGKPNPSLDIYASYARTPVTDSILTVQGGLTALTRGLGADYRPPLSALSFQGSYVTASYSDGNDHRNWDAQVSYRLPDSPQTSLRYRYASESFSSANPDYFSPSSFPTHRLLVNWREPRQEGLRGEVTAGLIYFAEDNCWGESTSGRLVWPLGRGWDLSLHASYDNASTKAPWTGTSLEVTLSGEF